MKMPQATAQTAPAAAQTPAVTASSLMKSLELPPDKPYLLDSIERNRLGRNAFLREFLSFLASIEDPCAVALDAAWGSGKTFFVKSAKLILEYLNPKIESDFTIDSFDIPNATKILPVYYDAWANDNAYDPLLSLILTIADDEHINQQKYFEKDSPLKEKLEAIASVFNGATVGATVGAAVGAATGNPASAVKGAEVGAEVGAKAGSVVDAARKVSKAMKEVKKPENPLNKTETEKAIEKDIREFLEICKNEVADRMVIFIDELDRCRPSFAVQLLERIKHYFHIDNVIFVLAVNSEQLVHTVRAFYGQDFDANRYLDRFFDFRVGLPPADVMDYLNELQRPKKDPDQTENQAQDQAGDQKQQIYSVDIVRALTEQYRLSLREVEKLCRALKTAGGNPDTRRKFAAENDQGRKAFCYYVLLPVIYTLKMTNLEQYNKFIEGSASQPLRDIFVKNEAAATYISEFTAANKKLNNPDNLVDGYEEIFNDPNCRDIRNDLLNLVNLLSPFACYH